MKKNKTISMAGLAVLFLLLATSVQMRASVNAKPGEHPAYLRALSDLRSARWMLNHRPGNWKQTNDELMAVAEIDKAIDEIKKASIDDGKDVNWHPKVDEVPDRGGRLHAAADYLRKAREDVNKEEDNGFARGLRNRALEHINGAIAATEKAVMNKM
jgi:tetratricopeptide (TPR) repeat protein